MYVLRDAAAVRAFLSAQDEAELGALIKGRSDELAEYTDELGDLVRFVVIQPTDLIEQIDAAMGFGILANRFDQTPFGAPGFTPSWDSLAEHRCWFELTYVLDDDGFGMVVYVPKVAPLVPALPAMCSQFTSPDAQEMSP